MNRFVFVAMVASVAFAVYWFFPRSTTISNYPSSGTEVIAFGDSLVKGVGATRGHDLVSLLSEMSGETIVNLGESGDTTETGLARIEVLDEYNPKVVIVLLGGNDYLRRVPEAQTFANLVKIIKNIQARGSVVLLLGIRGGLLNDHFDDDFRELRDTYKTAHVPNVLNGLFGNSEYMTDQIHPNDAGYQIMATRIYPVLAPLLK